MTLPLPGADESTQAQATFIEQFAGLNTRAARTAIEDGEFSWIENWVLLGDRNMRTLYAEGIARYTAPPPRTIVYHFAYNLGAIAYFAVFLDDGTATQVRISNGAQVSISSTSNTFWDGGDLPACAQWQSKYLLIVSTVAPNGYWIWDGVSLFGAQTLSPDVVVTRGGEDYTSAPTVTAYGGGGSGATFSATVANGVVTEVEVTNPGSGYDLGDQVVLAFAGGGSDDGAAATAVIDTVGGGISHIVVTDPGGAYTNTATVDITGGGGAGAEAVITAAFNGQILEITVVNPGTGYNTTPAVTITDPGGGTGFVGVAFIVRGQVTGYTVQENGTGYSTPPSIVVQGDGVGATAQAVLGSGGVAAINVVNPGLGYSRATVFLEGGNSAANARVSLMPFGVKGNTIETYQSRVWIGDGDKILHTAPASTSDFAASSGGGAFPVTESSLKRAITRLQENNGFLYRFGDSSIGVTSNVQTAGNPPTTTFNNSGVDAQSGAAWRETVVPFGRALMFANPTGIYALYGGAAEKVSTPLDGLFEKATFNTGEAGVTPSAAVATIFNTRVYCFLFTATDPFTGTLRDIIAMWNGQRWWVGTQGVATKALTTRTLDSVLACLGSTGTAIHFFFAVPSTNLQKTWQSKLRAEATYIAEKQVNHAYLLAKSHTPAPATFELSVDDERQTGGFVDVPGDFGQTAELSAFVVNDDEESISTFGYFLGMSLRTSAPDATMISAAYLWREYSPNA